MYNTCTDDLSESAMRGGETRANGQRSANSDDEESGHVLLFCGQRGGIADVAFYQQLAARATMVYRKKRMHRDNKDQRKRFRTRRYTKDLDQVLDDAKPEAFEKLKHQDVDLDMPGLAQFYCVACA